MYNLSIKVFKVSTEDDVEGKRMKTIGYTSITNQSEIEQKFSSVKYYTIKVEEIDWNNLVEIRERLKVKLENIDDALLGLG